MSAPLLTDENKNRLSLISTPLEDDDIEEQCTDQNCMFCITMSYLKFYEWRRGTIAYSPSRYHIITKTLKEVLIYNDMDDINEQAVAFIKT